MSAFDLSGRVAVITVGNGGIGLGMARALLSAGCAVSIWGRNRAKNEAASRELSALGEVDSQVCDVACGESISTVMTATLHRYDRVDGCFANAGVGGGKRSRFCDISSQAWKDTLAINLTGSFLTF